MTEQFKETLYDYANRLAWVRNLNWPPEKLRQIPVHIRQKADEPFISLPVEDLLHHEEFRGLFVYKSDVSPEIWGDLVAVTAGRGPSGREPAEGIYGQDKDLLGDISSPY